MSRRPASVWTHPRELPDSIGEYPLGRQRVVELVVQTDDNGNKGKIFFKCPSNIKGLEGVRGWCPFYEWPRHYLSILVDMGKIVMVLGQEGGEEEADSRPLVARGRVAAAHTSTTDDLVGAVKTLSLVLGAGVVVGAAYVFK